MSTPTDTSPITTPKLIVILPVYNEADVISDVAHEWLSMLDGLDIPYRLQLCNDGSTDGTAEVLATLKHASLETQTARNRGHGPTILRAYRAAMERAPWVFQCDSDGELPASSFPQFWAAREKTDLVIGRRIHRGGPLSRRSITFTLRVLLRLLFGKGITDGNCPYRLIRSTPFFPLMDQLPEDTFAPNVLLSGFSLRNRLRIRELPVPFTPRQTGTCSIQKWKLLKAAFRSATQTLAFRFRKPPSPEPS
jgi:glycosyltransferase involved in cell wall biosynthesis